VARGVAELPPPVAAQAADAATPALVPAARPAQSMGAPAVAVPMGAARLAAPAPTPAAASEARLQRDARAPLPVVEWIALIRKLRDEGRDAEAAKELAAFRSAHPDHEQLLPPDLLRWQPGVK
jgi:hypothetical protein